MKKTLIALAVLGVSTSGSALAADVQVYGLVDLGLKYVHKDYDGTKDNTNSLEVASGSWNGSRFGIKGSEDLGNGLKVGFVLENGIKADEGSLANNGRIFGRESQVYLSGDFGTLSFGRVGMLNSASGSYGIAGIFSPFTASWAGSVEGSTFMVGYTRTDNTVTYVSPEFANFKVYAQYSLDNNAKTESSEGKSNADRYGALGVTYNNGPVHLVALADTYNWSSWQSTDGDADDGYTFTLGGYYNFGFMKVYLGAQYFDNIFQKSTVNAENMAEPAKYQDKYATIGTTSGQFQGYSITGGIDTPVLGGTAMLAVGYSDTEQTETADNALHKESMARLGASVGYTYALSKRTSVYGVAAYYRDSYDHYQGAADNYDMSTTTAWVGMVHRF